MLPPHRNLGRRQACKDARIRRTRRLRRRPQLETLEPRHLLTAVTSVVPIANAHDAALNANVVANFDQTLDGGTVDDQSFIVRAGQTGRLLSANGDITSLAAAGSTITLNPAGNYFPGEQVTASALAGVESSGAQAADPFTWQFRALTQGGSGQFQDSGQTLSSGYSYAVEAADIDGDGDLDAVVAGGGVWLNQGGAQAGTEGTFANSQALAGYDLAIGDLDGDGDLDAFVGNRTSASRVWINQGGAQAGTAGSLTDSGQLLNGNSIGVALGDVDGDGDLDAFATTNAANVSNILWINQGGAQAGTEGTFVTSGQALGTTSSTDVAFGDLDGDGDLDAFISNGFNTLFANTVLINQGGAQGGTLGTFTDSGQALGFSRSQAVALGDVDGDGDLDAFVANAGASNRLWVNQGGAQAGTAGVFLDSGQAIGLTLGTSSGVRLGDVDADGDLDAFVANSSTSSRLWLNQGGDQGGTEGVYLDAGLSFGTAQTRDVALADMNGDGDLDAFLAVRGTVDRFLSNLDPAELSISKTSGQIAVADGGAVSYTITVANSGDAMNGVTVTDTFPPELTGVAWTAVTAGGATGTLAGSGDISETVNLPSGASITYTVTGTVVLVSSGNQSTRRIVSNTASVAPPSSAVDIDPSDNTSTDADVVVLVATQGSAEFGNGGQAFGNVNTWDVELGDLDGDGDLDAWVANVLAANQVWINQGGTQGGTEGAYLDSGQALGNEFTRSVALGDVDGDGDLDAVESSRVWINQGGTQGGTPADFVDSGQPVGNGQAVELGDLDGDGDLDALYSNRSGNGNELWLNQGGAQGGTEGTFANSGRSLGFGFKTDLGDLDGDGDLDLFNSLGGFSSAPNEVWFNQGGAQGGTAGTFVDSGQTLGSGTTYDSALGDVDGDGDLDAFVANNGGSGGNADRVWLNQGGVQGGTPGIFADSGQMLGSVDSTGVRLGDLDADGDLDAFVGSYASSFNHIWVNQGGAQGGAAGTFIDNGQTFSNTHTQDVALGDVDGDGDIDAFAAVNATTSPNILWLNREPTDVSVTKTNNLEFVTEGDAVQWTITVVNNGPFPVTGAGLSDVFSPSVTGVSWTAVLAGGAAGNTSGTGDIDETLDLPVGASVTYTVDANLVGPLTANQAAERVLTNGARITLPENFADTQPGDNTSIDGDLIHLDATGGPALFTPVQRIGTTSSGGSALGDIDGDGDLDVVVTGTPDQVLINQGGAQAGTPGELAGSGQNLLFRYNVALGDIDGDGDLDLVGPKGTSTSSAPRGINQGGDQGGTPGVFVTNSHFTLATGHRDAALGDLDGDGDLDVLFGGGNSPGSVWLNRGGAQGGPIGSFENTGQSLGPGSVSTSRGGVALGDVDGDGDLDAVITLSTTDESFLWINQGGEQGGEQGVFLSGQGLGTSRARDVALGDIDGDGDLDIVFANDSFEADTIWLNQGGIQAGTQGAFVVSAQMLGVFNIASRGNALADFDGDGDLDIFVAGGSNSDNAVHINQGGTQGGTEGTFLDTEQFFDSERGEAVSVGDLDGDGDIDAFVSKEGTVDTRPDEVYFNTPPLDYGDATPDYPIRASEDGARHVPIGPLLGTLRDAEADARVFNCGSPCGQGDDTTLFGGTDDEDGVTFTSTVEAGLNATVDVIASAPGLLNAFIDFNGDGDWDEPNEQIFTDESLIAGTNGLTFAVPLLAVEQFSTGVRFRLSTAGGDSSTGFAADGEVEDYSVEIISNVEVVDIEVDVAESTTAARAGSTPGALTYTVTATNNGPSNATGIEIDHALLLPAVGSLDSITPAAGTTYTGAASGTWMIPSLFLSQSRTLTIVVSVDGTALEAIDAISDSASLTSVDQLDSDDTNDSDSEATSISARDWGDAPDPTYPTRAISNGAQHMRSSGLVLGATADAEVDGQESAAADGDDSDPTGDDEDGVTFTSTLMPGNLATVDVVASEPGNLFAWIDFNGDGDWNDGAAIDPGEQIFTAEPLVAGVNSLSFTVPAATLLSADTFARFRLGSATNISYNGIALDGEVEDYMVTTTDCGTGVINTADSGDGSLRAALLCANATPGVQTVVFDIPGAGPHTIQPLSPLPAVTDAVVIDATTQPGYAGAPLVEIDGSTAGAGADGLMILAGGSTVRGLAINRFAGDGIELRAPGGNTLEANYIGTDPVGTVDLGNGRYGVRIFRSPNNVVGGAAAAMGNVISGNGLAGVLISGAAATGNLVGFNLIGTDAAGSAALGNDGFGVQVFAAPGNTIADSVISANGRSGVGLTGGATGNTVDGNLIGSDLAGTGALANAGHGVWISGSSSNTVSENVVSGNARSGVVIAGASTLNMVIDNLLGTDALGTGPLPNGDYGGQITGGSSNNTFDGNLISANLLSGVVLNGSAANNTLFENDIGTNLAGTADLGNARFGIWMSGVSGNTLEANTVSGNDLSGIALVDGSTGNTLRGNGVGTSVAGTAAVGNTEFGVLIEGGSNNTVETNLISGNLLTGVVLKAGTAGNTIRDNQIGTDLSGTGPLGNGRYGIWASAGAGNILDENVVSANGSAGISIRGTSTGTLVRDNLVGTDATGTAPLGNAGFGVQIVGSAGNTIGGNGVGNVIGDNGLSGVNIAGATATGNLVQGNFIGTDAGGTLDLGNAKNGVQFTQSASDNTVGGTAAGAGNAIAFNGAPGVRLYTGNTGNAILGNSFYQNTGLGIDQVSGGPTVNDAGDGDVGANNLQNTPQIDGDATLDGSDLLVTYLVDSTPVTSSAYNLRVEFFRADIDGQEGRTLLGTDIYTPANFAAGNKTITLTGIVGLSPGDRIVATATDANGNTSEFSGSVLVVSPPPLISLLGLGLDGDEDYLAAVDEVFAEAGS